MTSIGARRPADSLDPRQLLEEGAQLARAAGRSVLVDAGDLPDRLRCDPQGLRLALKVLVVNAIQYGPAAAPLSLSGRCGGGGIELAVRDRGAGVPPAETGQIFAKGWRGSNAGQRPGSGLGLYMARAIVDVHGGTLGVRNLEEGAEFRIWLPVTDAAGKVVASGRHRSDNSRNNFRLALDPKNGQG
jgi:signal transduction histidine kinase